MQSTVWGGAIVETLVFVLFRVRLHHFFIEAAALRSIWLRYAGTRTATRVPSFFPFVSLEM